MKKVLVLVLLVMFLPALVACTASGGESSSVAATEIPAPVEATLPATAEQPNPTSPAAMDPDADEAAVPAELAVGALGDLTYQGILDMPITLNGGRFDGEPAVEGSAGHPMVTLLPESTAYGDLNGDGRPDSAVMLAAESGGSGTFVYMAVVSLEDGRPVNLATTQLGDRVQVKELAIENGQIVVTLLTQGPDDPMCCPTQTETRVYRVEGSELIQVDGEG